MAATDAGRGNTVASAAAAEFVRQGQHQACARGGERVSQTNGSTVDVDLLNIDLKVLDASDGLAGERFVDLPTVDVVDGQTGTLQGLLR